MRAKTSLFALLFCSALVSGAFALDDPYVWLEEVHGAKNSPG